MYVILNIVFPVIDGTPSSNNHPCHLYAATVEWLSPLGVKVF